MKPLYVQHRSYKRTLKPLRNTLAHDLKTYRRVVSEDGLNSTREIVQYGAVIGSALQITSATIMLENLVKEGKLKFVDIEDWS